MAPAESVVFVAPEKVGGVLSVIADLVAHRAPDAFTYAAVLTHDQNSRDTRYRERLHVDAQATVEHSLPFENVHAVLRRLHRALPPGDGVLVTADLLELALASSVDLGRTVMMVLHGDHPYYYDLAERHHEAVDVFICIGAVMADTLRRRLPWRADSVVYLPYGIPMPAAMRRRHDGPLRLLFAGRIEDGQKGVLDLPAIDAQLHAAGVEAAWTIVGGGPDEQRLRERWPANGRVRWLGVLERSRVIEVAAEQDVFVLPTKHEGVPVALIEAMSVGLVPVVSDLPSGIREVVEPGVSGFTPAPGDVAGFAETIASLHRDRARLESMSAASRARVEQAFDIRRRVRGWQALFARHHDFRRTHRHRPQHLYGSRLDQPWLPNTLVRAVRSLRRPRHEH